MSERHPEETMAFVASDPDSPVLPDELIDELLPSCARRPEITGPEGLLQRLMKRLVDTLTSACSERRRGHSKAWASSLAPEHPQLMPKNEDLHVLRALVATEEDQELEPAANRPVQNRGQDRKQQ